MILCANPLCVSNGLAWGYATGSAAYLAGIVLSALADLPTGAVVVWTLAMAAGVAAFVIESKSRTRKTKT